MENATLARPYAKAAFKFALAETKLDVWSDWLSQLASVVQNSKIRALLTHPSVSRDTLGDTFITATQLDAADKRVNFLRLLAHRQRLALLPEIAMEFNQLKAAREKVLTVTVKTVAPIADNLKERLHNALKIRLGCEVVLAEQIDKSLVGGAILRAGDLVIDGSIRGKLQKLREQLLK